MKITEISRSFSKTIQEEPFEPLSVFAAYKAEVDEKDNLKEVSEKLHNLAQEDVRKVTDMWTNKRAALKRQRQQEALNQPPF